MSDDEDYNSEEDLDYVPSEGEQVSEEENSGDEEDLSLLQDGEGGGDVKASKRRPAGKKKKASLTVRQRKGGIKLDDTDQDAEKSEKEKELSEEEKKRKKELAEQIAKEEEERKQEKDKKRVDDLWASFMSDVKGPKRPSSSSSTGSGLGTLSSNQVKTAAPQNKVTITKVFDFAGEEIKVTKEVDADSKEAKAEMKKQEKSEEEQVICDKPTTPQTIQSTQPISSLKRPAAAVAAATGGGGGGAGGLGSVLSKIGKKSKMGTLEKSKMDWESFKSKEGIVDDLKIHNKGKQGYTERMAFLNRTDQRQFEMERDLRLGTSSKR